MLNYHQNNVLNFVFIYMSPLFHPMCYIRWHLKLGEVKERQEVLNKFKILMDYLVHYTINFFLFSLLAILYNSTHSDSASESVKSHFYNFLSTCVGNLAIDNERILQLQNVLLM